MLWFGRGGTSPCRCSRCLVLALFVFCDDEEIKEFIEVAYDVAKGDFEFFGEYLCVFATYLKGKDRTGAAEDGISKVGVFSEL